MPSAPRRNHRLDDRVDDYATKGGFRWHGTQECGAKVIPNNAVPGAIRLVIASVVIIQYKDAHSSPVIISGGSLRYKSVLIPSVVGRDDHPDRQVRRLAP